MTSILPSVNKSRFDQDIQLAYIPSTCFKLRFRVKLSSKDLEKEEFEDTKRVIRIRKSKDGSHNGKTQQDKRTYNDLQTLHIQPKIE
jgi:hypothetical protein